MIQIIKIIFICCSSILNSRGNNFVLIAFFCRFIDSKFNKISVFAGPNTYTRMESETACSIARSASLLSYTGFLQPTFMRTCPAVGAFSEMGGEGVRLLFSQLSRCSFDTSCTSNFAKLFSVEIFSP